MIILNKNALLGGGVAPRDTHAGKIGVPKDRPAKGPEVALDTSRLLTRESQAHGAKLGDSKWAPPSATVGSVALDANRLLTRGEQAHGAKIGDGKMMSPFARQAPVEPAKSE